MIRGLLGKLGLIMLVMWALSAGLLVMSPGEGAGEGLAMLGVLSSGAAAMLTMLFLLGCFIRFIKRV